MLQIHLGEAFDKAVHGLVFWLGTGLDSFVHPQGYIQRDSFQLLLPVVLEILLSFFGHFHAYHLRSVTYITILPCVYITIIACVHNNFYCTYITKLLLYVHNFLFVMHITLKFWSEFTVTRTYTHKWCRTYTHVDRMTVVTINPYYFPSVFSTNYKNSILLSHCNTFHFLICKYNEIKVNIVNIITFKAWQ